MADGPEFEWRCVLPVRPVEHITLHSVVNYEGFRAAFNEILGTEKQEEPMGARLTIRDINAIQDRVAIPLPSDPLVEVGSDGIEFLRTGSAQVMAWARDEAGGLVAMHGYTAAVLARAGLSPLRDCDRVVLGADGESVRILRANVNAAGQSFVPVTVADDYVDVLMKDGSTQTINLSEQVRKAADDETPWFAPAGLARGVISDADLKPVRDYQAAYGRRYAAPPAVGVALPKLGDTVPVSLGAAAIGAIRLTLDRIMATAGFQLTTGEHDICRTTADAYEGAPRTAVTKEMFETTLFGKLLSHSKHRTVAEIRNLVTALSEFLIDGPDQDAVSLRRKVSDHAANMQSIPHKSPVAESLRKIFLTTPGKRLDEYRDTGWEPGAEEQARFRAREAPLTQAASRMYRPGQPPTETHVFAYDHDQGLTLRLDNKVLMESSRTLKVIFPAPGEPMNPEAIKLAQGLENGSVRFDGCTKVDCGDHKINPMPFVCADCGMTLLQIVRKSVRTCVPVQAPPPASSHSERVAPRTHPAPTGGPFRTRAGGQGLFLPNGE